MAAFVRHRSTGRGGMEAPGSWRGMNCSFKIIVRRSAINASTSSLHPEGVSGALQPSSYTGSPGMLQAPQPIAEGNVKLTTLGEQHSSSVLHGLHYKSTRRLCCVANCFHQLAVLRRTPTKDRAIPLPQSISFIPVLPSHLCPCRLRSNPPPRQVPSFLRFGPKWLLQHRTSK